VKPCNCPREIELWDAIETGRWPDTAERDLLAHVDGCWSCHELAVVAMSLRTDAADIRLNAAPASSAIVWWRAQMRARQEAERAADRPIGVVHALAIASGAGLTVGLAGSVLAWLKGSTGLIAGQLARVDFTSGWLVVPGAMILASIVIMPIVFYAILADD
jgi:hypothetical protein